MIKTILWDVDGTLLDFQAADRAAFENDADALTVNTAVSGAAATENTANVGDSDGVNYLV